MIGQRMEIEEIYEHYRDLVAQHVSAVGTILKADCYNEAQGGFQHIEGVGLGGDWTTYVELDPEVIERARQRFPHRHFMQGDIRHLEFDDGAFDSVVDLSTLDHIPAMDIRDALQEYYRVLKPGGNLILVCWCSDTIRREPIDWDGPQYFHDQFELDCDLAMIGFKVVHAEIFHRSDETYLIEFVAEKGYETTERGANGAPADS